MSNYRISASTKDAIRKVYREKISKLDNKIEERGKALSQDIVDELNKSPQYLKFKEATLEFMDWIEEVDSDDLFNTHYYLSNMISKIKNGNYFSTPYRSNYERMFKDDKTIQDCIKEKEALSKECNKLIWNIEMSPKSSKEYKDAVDKAEKLLFKGDACEE